MGERLDTKLERLNQLELLLLNHPEGMTKAEIARRLDVHRSTAGEYIDDLSRRVRLWEPAEGRFAIDREAYKVEVRLTLDESLALHLAARLLTTRTDKHNPHAAAALRKLGIALEKFAPLISRHLALSADVLDDASRRRDPVFMQVLETLTRAWSLGKMVHLTHQMEGGDVFEYDFAPYFIEPYAVGRTLHVIGLREPPGKVRTFKVERIRTASLLRDRDYMVPAEFDPRAMLKDAWGIWYTEREPAQVVLRFGRKVAGRVRETQWHHTEQVTEEQDGSLTWRARIAEWQEMLPWIRGWGADVEVLEPKELRDALAREAQEMAEVYEGVEVERQVAYYAHSKDGRDKSEWQKLIDHLNHTANLAADFGRDGGTSELARIAALAHDIGKYSKEFQARLHGARTKVDHATAGAKELVRIFKGLPQEPLAVLLGYCVAGHHTGLPDYGDSTDLPGDGTLQARLKTEICDYGAYKTELDLSELEFPKRLNLHPLRLPLFPDKWRQDHQGFSISFLTRMVYSALVDADFQDTQEVMDEKKPRGGHESIEVLRGKFNAHVRQFDHPETDINCKRTETLRACVDRAAEKPGFFTLTVPTGGGKTLASMAFALNHAVAYGLKRIIYVIPFTSIIEQNAGVFKEILGEENVLEHHSNFDWEAKKREAIETAEDQTRSVYAKLRLAAENWDIPIVVTTNVQFFESLFANKSSRCRKLHNIAKSVIIFDEAQMLPKDYMLPAMSAVWELVMNYGASAVFCTATQPKLEKFLPEGTAVTELAPNPQDLFDFYKRVDVKQLDKLTDEDLVERLNGHEQALCIVNTRRHASGLFQKLDRNGSYHLSTLMCPIHRKQKLTEIRKRLESGQPCRVVSTSVMEAGIDVDFPVGYRALTGLDSINQAAGRVNRNMRRALGEVFVFEPVSEFIKRTPRYIAQGVEVTRGVLRDYQDSPISISAIDAYFERLYSLKEVRDFDYKDILAYFDNHQPAYRFATVAERFRIIEEATETVIIPFDEEAKRLIQELKFTQFPFSTLRKLQQYTVSIYQGEFEALSSKGVIETIADAYAVLVDVKNYYDPQTGLLVPAGAGGDAIIA